MEDFREFVHYEADRLFHPQGDFRINSLVNASEEILIVFSSIKALVGEERVAQADVEYRTAIEVTHRQSILNMICFTIEKFDTKLVRLICVQI